MVIQSFGGPLPELHAALAIYAISNRNNRVEVEVGNVAGDFSVSLGLNPRKICASCPLVEFTILSVCEY
jgi:hypothetical protein